MNRLTLFIVGAILTSANLVAKEFVPMSVYFADASVGLMSGYSDSLNIILKTNDGGQNWRVVLKNNYHSNHWAEEKIHFVNANTGLVCIGRKLFKTIDQGETWFCVNDSSQIEINSISFVNEAVGWVLTGNGIIGSKSVFKTTNGGRTWVRVGGNSRFPSILWTIFFKDETTGWVGGGHYVGVNFRNLPAPKEGEIIKTTDGGRTWFNHNRFQYGDDKNNNNRVISLSINAFFKKIYFTNNQNGWAINERMQLFKTSDGGESWKIIYSGYAGYPQYTMFNSVFFIGSSGWLVGDKKDTTNTAFTVATYGVILKTVNDGKSWSKQFSLKSKGYIGKMSDIYFINEAMGWAIGYVNNWKIKSTKGYFLKTIDGGENWSFSQIQW